MVSSNIDKRVRYFTGQFLQQEDFTDEQAYHVDRLRRHQRQFHAPGIAEGLQVTADTGAATVKVAPGTCVDANGNIILLATSRDLGVSTYAGETVLVTIAYDEVESDPATVGGGGNTRWHERPRIELLPESSAPSIDTHIRLARITVTAGGTVASHDTSVRVDALENGNLRSIVNAINARVDALEDEDLRSIVNAINVRVDALEDGNLVGDASTINVRDYGAAGDGVTDDSAAFKAAIDAAVDSSQTRGNASIFVPTGAYLLNESGIFSYMPTPTPLQGAIRWFGAGHESSKLILNPQTASPAWFYDSSVVQAYQNLTFSDLQFESSNLGSHQNQANGFLLNSFGHDQGFQWWRCSFGRESLFQTLLKLDGSANASEMRFFGCRIRSIVNGVIVWSNSQAVNIELFGSDVEDIYGDVFVVDGDGGGSLKMFGGSMIWSGGSAAGHLLKLTGSNGLNHNFLFSGIKTEMRDVNAKLVEKRNAAGSTEIYFDDIDFRVVVGGAREAVNINIRTNIFFTNCRIPIEWNYRFTQTTGGEADLNSPGDIRFNNCKVPEDISGKFFFDNIFGFASATNCIATDNPPSQGQAIDFNLNWNNRTYGGQTIRLKTAVLKRRSGRWPRRLTGIPGDPADADEWTVQLPNGATIKNIYVFKPAAGGSVAPYMLHVGSNDKSTVYGSSISSQIRYAHSITVEYTAATMIFVGETENERTLRLWADPGGDATVLENLPGEVAIVEYY